MSVFRGYRNALIAAFGLLNAPHAYAETSGKQPHTDARVGDALHNIAATYQNQAERAKRSPKREPCGPEEYGSRDDLCAQWKAADAADAAAYWARISGFLSIAGLLGVIGALLLTRQSNIIARRSAEKQLRAYLSIELGALKSWAVGQVPNISIRIKNGGQTPAYAMYYYGGLFVEKPEVYSSIVKAIAVEDNGPIPNHVVHIGGSFEGGVGFNEPLREDEYSAMMSGDKLLYAAVIACYKDTFGVDRETRFYAHTGGKLFAATDAEARKAGSTKTRIEWTRERTGNEAT